MTPVEAQELLAQVEGMSPYYLQDHMDWKQVASALETIAGLRYEYAVQVGMEDKFAYAFMDDSGNFKFGPLALADWWQTDGEAAGLVAELKDMNPHTTACVVRRLAGEPEVVE